MPQLRYLDDAGTLRTLMLGMQPVLIGRVNSCDIVFIDDMISREHTRFDREQDGRYRVRDLGSRNKTHVNGQQVAETLLNPGDIIRVGDHVIEYLDTDAPREKINTDFLTPDTEEPADCDWIKIKAPLSLTLPQVEQLSELSANWGITSRPEDIADRCLSQIIIDMQAERGVIAVRGDEKNSIKPIAHRGLTRSPGGSLTPVSQSFVFAGLLQKVAGRYPQTGRTLNAELGFAATAMVAPLTYRGAPIGVIYIDRPSSRQPFGGPALQYLAAAGGVVGAAMAACSRRLNQTVGLEERAWISSIKRTHDALRSEPASNETFSVGHRFFPGVYQRGDFCDVFHLDEQRSLALLVDAGGQGNCGMAQAMAIRGAVANAAQVNAEDIDLPGTFNALNHMMAGNKGRQLVACAAVLCDLPTGRIIYINAGLIPPVVLMGSARLVTLDQPSLLLGIDANYVYEDSFIDMPAKFKLVMCTDGVTNGTNSANEAFGERRLHEHLLEKEAFAPADQIVKLLGEAFVTHVAGNSPTDDATFLVMGRD